MSNRVARARRRERDRVREGEHGSSFDGRVTAGLMAAVLVAYLPAVPGTFLWDDDAHVTRPELRSLGGLWRIWTDLGATQQYYPLLHTAFEAPVVPERNGFVPPFIG